MLLLLQHTHFFTNHSSLLQRSQPSQPSQLSPSPSSLPTHTLLSMASQNSITRIVLLLAALAAALCLVQAAVHPNNHPKPVQVLANNEKASFMETDTIRANQLNLNNNKQPVRQFFGDVFEQTVGSCRDFLSDCVNQRGCDHENGCYILQSTVARTCCKCFLECAAAGDIVTAGQCSGWAKDRGVDSCFTF